MKIEFIKIDEGIEIIDIEEYSYELEDFDSIPEVSKSLLRS